MRTCSTRLHHLHCRPSSAPTSQASPPGCHRAFLELFGVHRGGEGSSQYLSRFEHPASSAASVRDPGHRIPNRIGRADENISARAKSHGISRRQFGSKSRHRNRIGTGPSPPEANPTESRKTTRLVTLPSSTIRRSIVVSEFRLHDVNSLTRLMKCRGEVDRGGGCYGVLRFNEGSTVWGSGLRIAISLLLPRSLANRVVHMIVAKLTEEPSSSYISAFSRYILWS